MNRKQAMRSHIENKLSAAELLVSPFPHLVIENFFPADVYADVMRFNLFRHNPGKEWQSRVTSNEVTGRTPYHARKHINFHAGEAVDGPEDAMAFWDEMKALFLGDRWFDKLIIEKYRAYFDIRFGDIVNDSDFCDLFHRELFLQRHDVGYMIGPHTDVPTRVFTCIFSFADGNGFEEYGTELLRHEDRKVRCTGRDHYTMDGFKVEKVAPYQPNNFLLFFKTRQSFHSVKAITPDVPNQRYGMQYQFYEPKGGVFMDLSEPRNMAAVKDLSFLGKVKAKVLG